MDLSAGPDGRFDPRAPLLDLVVHHPLDPDKQFRPLVALVDTGADVLFLHTEIQERLELPRVRSRNYSEYRAMILVDLEGSTAPTEVEVDFIDDPNLRFGEDDYLVLVGRKTLRELGLEFCIDMTGGRFTITFQEG